MKIRKESQTGAVKFEAVLIVLILVVIGALIVLNLGRVRQQHYLDSITLNLRHIERAKDQWAINNDRTNGDTPTDRDLAGFMVKGISPPKPIIGEIYEINAVGSRASAIIPMRLCDYPKGATVTTP